MRCVRSGPSLLGHAVMLPLSLARVELEVAFLRRRRALRARASINSARLRATAAATAHRSLLGIGSPPCGSCRGGMAAGLQAPRPTMPCSQTRRGLNQRLLARSSFCNVMGFSGRHRRTVASTAVSMVPCPLIMRAWTTASRPFSLTQSTVRASDVRSAGRVTGLAHAARDGFSRPGPSGEGSPTARLAQFVVTTVWLCEIQCTCVAPPLSAAGPPLIGGGSMRRRMVRSSKMIAKLGRPFLERARPIRAGWPRANVVFVGDLLLPSRSRQVGGDVGFRRTFSRRNRGPLSSTVRRT